MPDPAKWKLEARTRLGLRLIDYPGKTPKEARVEIAKLLKNKVPTISGENVSPNLVARFVQSDDFQQGEGHSAVDGIVWAYAYIDNTALSQNPPNNTASIKKSEPVCLDTVTGRCVTGVHSSWSPDEYTIVGVALDDFTGPGEKRIPIKLQKPGSISSEQSILCSRAIDSTDPTLSQWMQGTGSASIWKFFPINVTNYTWADGARQMSSGANYTVDQTPIWAYNLRGFAFVPPGTQTILTKLSNGRHVFDWRMPPMLSGALAENMVGQGKVKVSGVSGLNVAGVSLGGDLYFWNDFADPRYYFPIGTNVKAAIHETATGVYQYRIIAVNTCPSELADESQSQ